MLNNSKINSLAFISYLKGYDPSFFSMLAEDLAENPLAGAEAVQFLLEDKDLSELFAQCDAVYFCQLMYEELNKETLNFA